MSKWIKNVTREVTIFPATGVTRSFGSVDNAFSIPFKYDHILFVDATWWYEEDKYEEIKKILKEKVEKDSHYVRKVVASQRKVGEALKEYIASLTGKEFSRQDLVNEIVSYDAKMVEFYSFWWGAIPTGEVLETKIRKVLIDKKIPIDFESLLFLPRELELMKERRLRALLGKEVLGIETFADLTRDLKDKFQAHSTQFGWITTSYHIGKALSAEDFFKKTKEAEPDKELFLIREEEEKQKNVLEEIKKTFNDPEFNLLQEMQEIIYLRNYQKETVNECQHKSEVFLSKIAQVLSISLENLLTLMPTEVVEALKEKGMGSEDINKEALKRKKQFALEYLYDKVELYTDTTVAKTLIYKDALKDSSGIIKGSLACKGKVTGKVRVILNKEDLKAFIKGEVMVTPMTSIDYVQSMKEASAIVTDEGGITCHAAIFSREFKIPCIIGTKTATSQLKTGDKVEVDAENGIVRIIN